MQYLWKKEEIKIRNIKLENVGKITLAQKFIRMNKFKFINNETVLMLPVSSNRQRQRVKYQFFKYFRKRFC